MDELDIKTAKRIFHRIRAARRKLYALKESFKVGDVVEVIKAPDQGPMTKLYHGKVGVVLTMRPDGIDYSCGDRFMIGVIIANDHPRRIKSDVNFHVLDLKKII